jgi:hypothetical protein
MTPKEIAVNYMALHILGTKVAQAKKAWGLELGKCMDPGGRQEAWIDDETSIGTVTRSRPGRTAKVTDIAALTEWIKANHPSEVYTPPAPPEMAREAFVSKLVAAAEAKGVAVDKDGQIIPGIDVFPTKAGDPKPTAPTPEQVQVLVDNLSLFDDLHQLIDGPPAAIEPPQEGDQA